MSYGVNFDDVDRLSRYDGAPARFDEPNKSFDFHESICSQYNGGAIFAKSTALTSHVTELEQRTQRAAKVAPMDANVGVKAEITCEWGGKDGVTVSGSISGSVSDDKGNSVEAKAEIDSDGSGRVSAAAEHEKDYPSGK